MSLDAFQNNEAITAYTVVGDKLIESQKEDLQKPNTGLDSSKISTSSGRLRKAVSESHHGLSQEFQVLIADLRDAIRELTKDFRATDTALKKAGNTFQALSDRISDPLRSYLKEQLFLFQAASLLLEKNTIQSWGKASALGCAESFKSQEEFLKELSKAESISILKKYGLKSDISAVKNVCLATRLLLEPLVAVTLTGRKNAIENAPEAPKTPKISKEQTNITAFPKKEELHGPAQRVQRRIPTAAELADKKKTRRIMDRDL